MVSFALGEKIDLIKSDLEEIRVNLIQHNDYIVILRGTNAFKSPLL